MHLPPSPSRNRFLFTVIDEYSRFSFAFVRPDLSSQTNIKCLTQHFIIFCLPMYPHSDMGSSFISIEVKTFFHGHEISINRTTPYNLKVMESERGIMAYLENNNSSTQNITSTINQWKNVLLQALHLIRTLVSTAAKATPHERLFNYSCRSSSGCSVAT